MQGIAQGRQLDVAFLAGTGGNVGGLVEQLLGQQFGAGQFDQIERATHLVHGLHRLLQQAAVLTLGNEVLEALFRLFHGGEQFIAHETQRSDSSDHASVRLPRECAVPHQSANSGFCLLMWAVIATRRSADCSMAAFQVAMYSRPSSTRWSRM